MVSKRQARANRRKALADTQASMTLVAKIRKERTSGRPRKHDQILSPLTAYALALAALDELKNDMRSNKLDPADARASLVVNDLSQDPPIAYPFTVTPENMEKTLGALCRVTKPLPVGVVYIVRDRELPEGHPPYSLWTSQFLGGPAATDTLRQVLDTIKSGKQMDS